MINGNEKYRHLLQTDDLRHSLRRSTVRGGVSSFIGENVSFALRTVSTIVLARLLLPEHFGLIAMVTAVTTFADRFKDLGLDLATVQAKSITHEQVSTLFWINSGVGTVLMLLVCACSPLMSWFYSDQRLIPITLSIALTFFFGGITIQHQALLRRQMLFTKLAGINVISVSLSIVLGLSLAFGGCGYWALVASQVSGSLFVTVGLFIACRWKPGPPKRGCGIRAMLHFGRDVTVYNLLYFFTRSLDQILLGKYWGASTVGLYKQAAKLVVLPMEQTQVPLNNLAIPALSALQREPERYREFCRKIIGTLAFVNMPLSMYLAAVSEYILPVLLGDKWIPAIPVFRIFAILTIAGPLQFPCGFVMISSGRSRQYLWYGVCQSLLTAIGFAVGVRWGAVGVAWGYLASNLIFIIPGLWYSLRHTPVKMVVVFQAVLLPAVGGCVMTGVLLLASRYLAKLGGMMHVIYSLILAVSVYCVFWLIVPGGRAKLRMYVSYLTQFLRRN